MQTAPKVAGILCLCFCSLTLQGQTGFGTIHVGQLASTLPFPCTDFASCEGEYQSSWVRVTLNNGLVSNIHVIYSGKTRLGDPVEMTPPTLAQTVKMHSLQEGLKEPAFGLALGRNGSVYGVADIENQIVYITNSASPSSPVIEVVYVRSDAPVLDAAARAKLADGGGSLVQAARSAGPYVNQAKRPHIRGTSAPTNPREKNRIEMPQDLRELNDKDRGGGRRTTRIPPKAAKIPGMKQQDRRR